MNITNFKNHMVIGDKAENIIMSKLLNNNSVESVRKIGGALKKGKNIQTIQRLSGDLRIKKVDGSVCRIEVKSDGSMERTGNLFLETLSDNGERTGRTTLGWFDNPDSAYDWFVFYNRANPKNSIKVKRDELKDYVNSRPKLPTVSMKYDQT